MMNPFETYVSHVQQDIQSNIETITCKQLSHYDEKARNTLTSYGLPIDNFTWLTEVVCYFALEEIAKRSNLQAKNKNSYPTRLFTPTGKVKHQNPDIVFEKDDVIQHCISIKKGGKGRKGTQDIYDQQSTFVQTLHDTFQVKRSKTSIPIPIQDIHRIRNIRIDTQQHFKSLTIYFHPLSDEDMRLLRNIQHMYQDWYHFLILDQEDRPFLDVWNEKMKG